MAGMQNIPQHAAHLLRQAFGAMKEAQSSKPLHLEGNTALGEKKKSSQLVVIDNLSKPTELEVPESSK
jgi:uncharacterized 2Fe-2S/4Fe-4S cluster protein (DUF4445 family)